jgi:hypothetical protein
MINRASEFDLAGVIADGFQVVTHVDYRSVVSHYFEPDDANVEALCPGAIHLFGYSKRGWEC